MSRPIVPSPKSYPPGRDAPPTHTRDRLTHNDCYMYDVISIVQGGPKLQHRVFDGTVYALKWLFTSLPGESKDLLSVKKSWQGRATGTVSRKSWDGLLKQKREQSPY